MEILELTDKPDIKRNVRLRKRFIYFRRLLNEIKKKNIPEDISARINERIEEINFFAGSNKELQRTVNKSLYFIVKLLERKLKIVPRSFYRTRWLIMGMILIGIPLGAIIGYVMGKMVYLGLGIPSGLIIGLFIGNQIDKKALEENRQLDIDVEF